MSDYSELVKELRHESTWCEDFPKQKELFLQAADAIEEMGKVLDEENKRNRMDNNSTLQN